MSLRLQSLFYLKMHDDRLQFDRLFRMSKAVLSRESVNWRQLKAISQKMNTLVEKLDSEKPDSMSEVNNKFSRKSNDKCKVQ